MYESAEQKRCALIKPMLNGSLSSSSCVCFIGIYVKLPVCCAAAFGCAYRLAGCSCHLETEITLYSFEQRSDNLRSVSCKLPNGSVGNYWTGGEFVEFFQFFQFLKRTLNNFQFSSDCTFVLNVVLF